MSSRLTPSTLRLLLGAGALLPALSLVGGAAQAAPGSCDNIPTPHKVPYVIAMDTEPLVAGYTPDQFEFAIALAAETWNEQGNGTWFHYEDVYVGDQICTQRQIDCKAGTDSTCDDPWIYQTMCPETTVQIDCSQVPDDGLLVGAQLRVGWGEKRTICSDKSRVTFNTLKNTSTANNLIDRSWDTGLPAFDAHDLLFVLTHELGHVVGLGDHYSDQGTIMTSMPSAGDDMHDLYAWDWDCAMDSGRRDLDGYRRYLTGGSFGSQSLFTSYLSMTNGAPGVSRSLGYPHWAAVGNADSDVFFSPSMNSFSNPQDVPWSSILYSTSSAQSPRLVRFRGQSADTSEDRDIDYVVYSSEEDYEAADRGTDSGRHRMRYVRSDDGFVTGMDRGYLRVCTNMSSWTQCASSEYIYSAKPLTLAYNDTEDVSVAAWVHQGDDPGNHSNRHEIAIAVGQAGATTLGERQWLGVKSAVTPAMACRNDSSSSRDCFVAYVDLNDADGDIEIERFDLSRNASQSRYDLVNRAHVENPSGLSGVRTASSMSAWYHNDRYYLAIKSLEPGMPVRVFRSSWNGGSFTEVSGDFGTTVAGPEAVSHWQGNNVMATFEAP